MGVDIQQAGLWKRVSAFLFDGILFSILAVFLMFLISEIGGYDRKNDALAEGYARYEERFGISFEITEEEYLALPAAEKQRYDEATETLYQDGELMKLYNQVLNLTLLMISLGLLLAFLLLEFLVPLLLKEGRTLGKKIFGLCVIHTNGVRIDGVALFIRTVLGKYTLETMIPALLLILIYFNYLGLVGSLVIIGIGLLQLILYFATRYHSLIHDLLASTVVADYSSQLIFRDQQEMVAYKARLAAERAKPGHRDQRE